MISLNLPHIPFCQVEGIGFPNLGPRPQGSFPGSLGRQLRHQAYGNHLQASGSAGTCISLLELQRPCGFFQNLQGIGQAFFYICLHRGIGGSCPQNPACIHIRSRHLCIGASKVNQQDWFHFFHRLILCLCCFLSLDSKIFVQSIHCSFRGSSRSENPVKAHGLKPFFYLIEGLLAYHDISSHIEENSL